MFYLVQQRCFDGTTDTRFLLLRHDAPPPAELVRTLHAQQRPFFFCVRCRRVAEGRMCDKYGSQADCLKVDTEDDIQMALSAMS
ncbi:MAG: hypothetical protein ABI333_08245 [bacterium]